MKTKNKKRLNKKKILIYSIFGIVIISSITIPVIVLNLNKEINIDVEIKDQKKIELVNYINSKIIGSTSNEIISSFNNLKLDDSDEVIKLLIKEIYVFKEKNNILEFDNVVKNWKIIKETPKINEALKAKLVINIFDKYNAKSSMLNIYLTLKKH